MAVTSVIDTIKTKIDIADEIGTTVVLQRSGKSLKGLCPFHGERTPSFYVFRETQTWHCFGCNEGGDIFSFVQKQQNLDFREALTYLAEKAGVPIEEPGEQTEEEKETSVARERLLKLNETATLWFHQMLLRSKEAEGARAYVKSRGISSDSVVTFGLGYASEKFDLLTRYLLDQGYSEHELVAGGLARWRESEIQPGRRDGLYDYFRHRLIFPIRDIRGRVIGFGGRALGDTKPKYLNSPQTLLFEKNTVLYGIDTAKDAIKQIGQVVIVEGYVDAIIAQQYGTRQTVACIGSAITEKHIQQLKKLTRQVTLALDPDAAGHAATEHGIQEALKGFDRTVVPVPLTASETTKFAGTSRSASKQPTMSPRGLYSDGKGKTTSPPKSRGIIRLEEQIDAVINVVQLPGGQDPDEIIRNDLSTWLYAVSHPLSLIDYFFVIKTADLKLREPTGKAEAAHRLLPVIAMISDRIKRDAYVRKLASMIQEDERTVHAELQKVIREKKMIGVNAAFTDKSHGKPTTGFSAIHQVRESGKIAETDYHSELDARNEEAPELFHKNGLDSKKLSRIEWEDYLIGLLLRNPGLSPYVCGIITDGDFAGTDTRELYHILNSVYQRDASSSLQPIEQFIPAPLLPTVARVTRCVESKSPLDGAGLVKEAIQCATRLKRSRLVQLNTELKFLLLDAIEAGDKNAVRQVQQQQQQIYRQLRTINSATHLQG